jgi:hypothetical protein
MISVVAIGMSISLDAFPQGGQQVQATMQALRIFNTGNSSGSDAAFGYLIRPKGGRAAVGSDGSQTEAAQLGEHGWAPKEGRSSTVPEVPETKSMDAAALVDMIIASQHAPPHPDPRPSTKSQRDEAAPQTSLREFKDALRRTAETESMPLVFVSMTKTASKTQVTLQLSHLQLYEQPTMLAELFVFFKYRPRTASFGSNLTAPATKGVEIALVEEEQEQPSVQENANVTETLEVCVIARG